MKERWTTFALLLLMALLLAYGFARLTIQGNELTAIHISSSKNRVENVSTWCGAINEGRKEGLRLHHKEKAYKIHLLNCLALEQATEASSKLHHH